MTAAIAMIASTFFAFAIRCTVSGISHAPGTRMTVMLAASPPWRTIASIAPLTRWSTMKWLKRLATIAAAVARRRREDVADRRARVHAAEDRRVSCGGEIAAHERDELALIGRRFEDEGAPFRAGLVEHDVAAGDAPHEALGLEAI